MPAVIKIQDSKTGNWHRCCYSINAFGYALECRGAPVIVSDGLRVIFELFGFERL